MSFSPASCFPTELADTRCTPFLLMYGREARLPIDVTRVDGTPPDEVDFATKVLEFQKKVHDEARLNVEKAQDDIFFHVFSYQQNILILFMSL